MKRCASYTTVLMAGRRKTKAEQAQKVLDDLARVLRQDAPPLADVPFRLEPEPADTSHSTQPPLTFDGLAPDPDKT